MSQKNKIREPSGNITGTYTQEAGNTNLSEQPIYASGRIGLATPDGNGTINKYSYELTDHLGNVRATFGKTSDGLLSINTATDYYPFGMTMDGRTYQNAENYRFGYQGQFAEKDEETGYNQFELRLYDARIGRWMSPDPYGQHWSPYLAMGNSPVNTLDPDGGLDEGWLKRLWVNIKDKINPPVDGGSLEPVYCSAISGFTPPTAIGIDLYNPNYITGKDYSRYVRRMVLKELYNYYEPELYFNIYLKATGQVDDYPAKVAIPFGYGYSTFYGSKPITLNDFYGSYDVPKIGELRWYPGKGEGIGENVNARLLLNVVPPKNGLKFQMDLGLKNKNTYFGGRAVYSYDLVKTTKGKLSIEAALGARIKAPIWSFQFDAIPSDSTLKDSIVQIKNSLQNLVLLNGYHYVWKDSVLSKDYGVIAQEIELYYPEMVYTDSNGVKAVYYYKLIPVLIEAVKEQQKIIDAQTEQIELLINTFYESNDVKNKYTTF